MSAEAFIDTNVWVYAHLEQAREPRCARALELVERPVRYTVSAQILGEYSSAMLRNGVSDTRIRANVAAMSARCDVRDVTGDIVLRAWEIRLRYKLSWWDSQLLASALDAGCEVLYSEDLQDGLLVETRLRVVNPFR